MFTEGTGKLLVNNMQLMSELIRWGIQGGKDTAWGESDKRMWVSHKHPEGSNTESTTHLTCSSVLSASGGATLVHSST